MKLNHIINYLSFYYLIIIEIIIMTMKLISLFKKICHLFQYLNLIKAIFKHFHLFKFHNY